jgi:hypothetical protein
MANRPLIILLVVGFAVAVGDFGFRTFNPAVTPEYMIEDVVEPYRLDAKAEPPKHLYLRQTWRLTEPPEQAWIRLMGHDVIEVWVNGRRAGYSSPVGYGRITGVVMDVSPLLHAGENTIAIHAAQLVLHRPPQVAIDGVCRFADGASRPLNDPDEWRAAGVYERRGAYWYETEFEDDHWAKAAPGPAVRWRSQVNLPPGAVTHDRLAKWISPPGVDDQTAGVAATFELDGPPRDGWIRVLTTGSERIALNGKVLTDVQEGLGIQQGMNAKELTFDVSPLLRKGRNVVSIVAETSGEAPRFLADLAATTIDGRSTYLATDESWKGAAGLSADWLDPQFDQPHWQQCEEQIGYQGIVPRSIVREMAIINPPGMFWVTRGLHHAGWIVGSGIVAALGAWLVGSAIRHGAPDHAYTPSDITFVPLLPVAVAAAAGGLMTWDLAWAGHDVYQPKWLLGLWLGLAAQWVLLLAVGSAKISSRSWSIRRWAPGRRAVWTATVIGWGVLGSLALWLRLRDLTAEPIHHDEVTVYAFTETVFTQGFPGGQVHPDIPFGYAATNELCYFFNAISELFFDDPLLVIRVPSVVWSMLTLALLAYMGWKWFDGFVGAVVAVLFALSPHMIGFADFGRYLAQVQFFSLLTMFLTYEAVRGTGRPNVPLMWGATLSFIAMYYSWEGAGMFGFGLALAVFFHRRRHLVPLLSSPHLYMASTVLVLSVIAQNAHRIMQQTQRLWYGEGISSLTIKPMWRYPFFQHDYYLINSAWTRDALLPMIALVLALAMAIGHRWRAPLRFSLFCLIVNAEMMAAFLPVRTNRYACHLIGIMMLISAAVVVAGAEALLNYLRSHHLRPGYRWYARVVSFGTVAAAVALASGWTVRTAEMTEFANAAFDVKQLRIPDWDAPTEFLHEHLKEGDVVISIFPHTTNFNFVFDEVRDGDKIRTVDYWLQSRLIIQATIGDSSESPRDRRSGAVMLHNIDQVKKLFAENDRIWYCTMRMAQGKLNDSEVSQFLRQHMDVVSEDFATALMLRDKNHRPAPVRVEEDEAGQVAGEYFLR